MSRRIAALAACILVLTASTAVYAAEAPETVIEETGSGTSISITDITPREGGTDEAKGQLAYGSYYPVEIQTTEEDGIKLESSMRFQTSCAGSWKEAGSRKLSPKN